MIQSLEERTNKVEFLRPLVKGWLGVIKESVRHRKGWDEIAAQCQNFFAGATGFMWNSQFQSKYIRGSIAPRFQITLQKAFELVALFGPSLYHHNPDRVIKPRKELEFGPEVFGGQEELFQQAMQMQQMRATDDKIRAQLMELYLNYTPTEQPNGGLARASMQAITEGLVQGRGVLWPEAYEMPGSSRKLTGCFWDQQSNLFYDPDANSLDEAWWVAKREIRPWWEVEREFNLPKDSLKDYASNESLSHRGASIANDDLYSVHRQAGHTNDLIVYWRIWSKMGVGARIRGITDTDSLRELDRACGDHCYIVVAEDVPWPLNAPSERLKGEVDEEIEKRFRWPIPFWRDDKWPFALLEFYPNPKSLYPIAPMAPGLGELSYLNIFVSHLAGRIWSSSRDFIAVAQKSLKEIEPILKAGEDLAIIPVGQVTKNINEVISFLQQPNVSFDAWQIVDRLSILFEKRTGLNELLYGNNPGGTQERTATGAQAKERMTQIRPDYMATQVESWMEEAADMEKFCARWYVEGQDVRELVGDVGALLWDEKVVNTDPEIVVREMRATVAAGSTRKPNREKDAENFRGIASTVLPLLDKHADVTGDTGPVNAAIRLWGESADQDVAEFEMGPRQQQPPDEQTQQMQQQQMQLEMGKLQTDVQKGQLDVQKGQLEVQKTQSEAENTAQKLAMEQQQREADVALKGQDMQLKAAETELKGQELQLKAAETQLKAQDAQTKSESTAVDAEAKAIGAASDLRKAELEIEEKQMELEAKAIELEIKRTELQKVQKELQFVGQEKKTDDGSK